MLPVIASNGAPYLQMRLVGSHSTSGREKEGWGETSARNFRFSIPATCLTHLNPVEPWSRAAPDLGKVWTEGGECHLGRKKPKTGLLLEQQGPECSPNTRDILLLFRVAWVNLNTTTQCRAWRSVLPSLVYTASFLASNSFQRSVKPQIYLHLRVRKH